MGGSPLVIYNASDASLANLPMGNAASVVEEAKTQGNARFAKGDLAGAVKLYKHAVASGGAPHLLQSNLSATYHLVL